jgi:hypothetical protein
MAEADEVSAGAEVTSGISSSGDGAPGGKGGGSMSPIATALALALRPVMSR